MLHGAQLPRTPAAPAERLVGAGLTSAEHSPQPHHRNPTFILPSKTCNGELRCASYTQHRNPFSYRLIRPPAKATAASLVWNVKRLQQHRSVVGHIALPWHKLTQQCAPQYSCYSAARHAQEARCPSANSTYSITCVATRGLTCGSHSPRDHWWRSSLHTENASCEPPVSTRLLGTKPCIPHKTPPT